MGVGYLSCQLFMCTIVIINTCVMSKCCLVTSPGITPLMFSAAGGNLSTAQILLDRGADPNALSACEITALDVATICNRPDISKCLNERTSHHKKKGKLTTSFQPAASCHPTFSASLVI